MREKSVFTMYCCPGCTEIVLNSCLSHHILQQDLCTDLQRNTSRQQGGNTGMVQDIWVHIHTGDTWVQAAPRSN